MVKARARGLYLLAMAALMGAVGIAPRRDAGSRGEERRDERRVGIEQRVAPPSAPAASAPAAVSQRVGIERRRDWGGRAPEATPSVGGPVRIQRRESVEAAPRRHYWHESGGRRYSHFFDGRVHWYGYPFASGFFWLRPYGGLWWTWDARFSRWVYWNDGFWWWLGPGGVQYVYIRDDYYPYDAARRAAYAAAPAPPFAPQGSWTSPDGRRLVEVSGADAQALLYDKTPVMPLYLGFLVRGVAKVRFSTAAPGAPPTIALELRDESLAVFDYDGRRLDTAKPAQVKETPPVGDVPPAPPGDLPPPPEDLPPPP